jgi:hypothetical protein
VFGFGYAAWRERRGKDEFDREVEDLLGPVQPPEAPVSPAI